MKILSRLFSLLLATVVAGSAVGQCPQLFDYDGIPSSAPEWFSCTGNNFTLQVGTPNSVGNFTIDWGDGSALYAGASLNPPQTVGHLYTAAVATYTITFTELSTGCVIIGTLVMEKSTSASIQIPVGGLTQVCAPSAVLFINSSTNVSPTTVFTWDFGDGSPILTFDHTNLGQTISHTYMPNTVNCETTVRLTAENTCNALQGGPSLATFNPIRIWDYDDASIAPSATLLCWPDNEVTYANTTARNCLQQGNIFQRYEYWNFGDYWGLGHDSILNWTPWPPTFPRTIAYPAIGSYEVMLLDSNYCGVDTARITINIVPPPTVTLTATPSPVCAGATVQFNETTVGGANYFEWDFGSGFNWTGAGDQTHAFGTPGSYTVRYAASIQGATAGCADTASVVVDVLPSPTAQFTLDNDAACDQLTVTLTNTSINGVNYSWDLGDGTTSMFPDIPPHTYSGPGEYVISLTVTNSQLCEAVFRDTVHVYSPPQVVIGAQNVCEGVLAQFSDLSVTDPGNPVIDWAWDFGDGATDNVQSPGHLYAGSGNFTVVLVATTPYCSNSGTLPILVEAKPIATFTPSGILGCSPFTVTFNNTSTGGVTNDWDFGDGSASSIVSPSHTFLNLGTQDSVYTVQLVVSTTSGCADTLAVPITVAPGVHALFTHNAQPGCAPLAVDFTNGSTGASSYAWDFDDGSTSTAMDPSHTYVNTTYFLQTRNVRLVAISSAGCSDTIFHQVIVYPTPDFTFVAQPDSGCSPHTVTLPQVVGAVSYNWDFGDGTTGSGPSPQHIYFNNTANVVVYPITLIGENAFGCRDTTFDQVTVFPSPVAQILVAPGTGCHPLTATLTNLTTGATSFSWNYGDGQTSTESAQSHDHVWYNYAGTDIVTYPITLTSSTTAGCTSTATAQVQVFPQVSAAFVGDSAGCSPLDAHFTNVSSGASTYQWSFGDGQTSTTTSPDHLYMVQGGGDITYNVLLTATSILGCSDTTSRTVVVHPQPLAQFVPNVQTGCQPLVVSFQDLSSGASLLEWNYGDGGTLNTGPGNVSHTFTTTGTDPSTFDVVLVASSGSGCTDTATTQVTVYPTVTAAFLVDTVMCSPAVLALVNSSTGAASWSWNMGDGVVLAGFAPAHTYVNNTTLPITRTIILTATSAYGCTSTATWNVTVHPIPNAAFQATPTSQQFPNATVGLFNNSSPGPWTHVWDFGDGTTVALQTPGSHTYGTSGTFNVMLVVSGAFCSDTAWQQVVITPPAPTARFIGQGEGCVPLTVQFTNTSLGAQSYQWNFGDGGTSSADNPVYTFNVAGVYTVSMTATGPNGGTSTAVKVDSVVVHPSANAYFVLQPDQVNVPSQPVFTYNLSANATQYLWDFGDGTFSTEEQPLHYYQQPGVFDVQLIANNDWNCPDTFFVPGAVTALSAGTLEFPNAFSPNANGPSDGVYDAHSLDNDIFFPLHEGVADYELEIFNRWGELLFVSNDVKIGWDGYYRGRPAKQDVYVYKARAKFSNGEETMLKGDITLIR